MKDDLVIFEDGHCPHCGRRCGNNGKGPMRCVCGWVGTEIDKDKLKESLDDYLDRLFPDDK